jgi:arginase
MLDPADWWLEPERARPGTSGKERAVRAMTSVGLLGVPSSAAAHWPGQEKAPRALRSAGMVRLLLAAGHDLVDHGDRPTVRWRPHPRERRPHDLSRVLDVLRDTREQVGAIFAAGQTPLVIGGECTLTVAVVSAALDSDLDVALVYFDGGPDLRTPADNPTGILDSMGVAHLLALPGAAPELAGLGPRQPLLTPDRVCFFGVTSAPPNDPTATDEDRRLDALASPTFRAAEVSADPVAVARQATAALTAAAGRFLVHFDVDVIDFFDLPVADVPIHNNGLTLIDAMAALTILVAHPGFAGLTVTEFNPDHADSDGATARTLAAAITAALAPLLADRQPTESPPS